MPRLAQNLKNANQDVNAQTTPSYKMANALKGKNVNANGTYSFSLVLLNPVVTFQQDMLYSSNAITALVKMETGNAQRRTVTLTVSGQNGAPLVLALSHAERENRHTLEQLKFQKNTMEKNALDQLQRINHAIRDNAHVSTTKNIAIQLSVKQHVKIFLIQQHHLSLIVLLDANAKTDTSEKMANVSNGRNVNNVSSMERQLMPDKHGHQLELTADFASVKLEVVNARINVTIKH